MTMTVGMAYARDEIYLSIGFWYMDFCKLESVEAVQAKPSTIYITERFIAS